MTVAPRGTYDILPDQAMAWQWMEMKIREVLLAYGYGEIRTPIFEHTELFLRGIGETTDIVEKEMYSFTDKGGRNLSLRPEGTAPVVRAYIQHKLHGQGGATKLFYLGPMFRQERPQAGRFRQFHQFGVELIGEDSPMADAEMIVLAHDLYRQLGLTGLEIYLNTVGCPVCRQEYKKELIASLQASSDQLCSSCRLRLDRNPLRVLDCKEASCQALTEQVPLLHDYLCLDCREHFQQVTNLLDQVQVKYEIKPKLVRGLDYYTRTVFEVINHDLGAQNAICGGGRYDGLVEECGGPSVPGVGFASGMERLFMTLEQKALLPAFSRAPQVYIIPLSADLTTVGFEAAFLLRQNGFKVEVGFTPKSLKAQLKAANRSGAPLALIIGEDEWQDRQVTLKQMDTGDQVRADWAELAEQIGQMLAQTESL
ncbi:MAG: histidine--tRNA ligase [Firmicutes bacterium]|nr:histidine--tRNA ligase [Bacillota bacterium]